MERIRSCFETLASQGSKPLIVYGVACDPDCEKTLEFFKVIMKYADMLEVGMPFSDPLADGPTIQKAHLRALNAGANTKRVLEIVEKLRKLNNEIPILLMGYYNPILAYGEDDFIRDSKSVGADGFIVPDLPPEEGEEFSRKAKSLKLSPVFLCAPTSTEERIRKIGKVTGELIYYVSVTGITGERDTLAFKEIQEHIYKIKEITGKRTVVGFGISRGSHIRSMYEVPDGFVVGSAVVKFFEREDITGLENLLKELKEAVKK
jgi:tryptophan synthase alpha chain